MSTILVTGGAGFIGSAVVRRALAGGHKVVNVDALTDQSNLENVASVASDPGYVFEHVDIRDGAAMRRILDAHRPRAVLNLAAESHVDRSIDGPGAFIGANIVGVYELLQAVRAYWSRLEGEPRARFRFVQVSTDEVFGALGEAGRFTETSRYAPRSPYAASKAAGDHLARAWRVTYDLPVLITNGCNTYGPFQFPEKLIPVTILKAMAGAEIPVYGTGDNVRDWLHVDDHADALLAVATRGAPGETFLVGGDGELRNIDLVRRICRILDVRRPQAAPHDALIRFVADRPGHDFRYSVDAEKLRRDLDWRPRIALDVGLEQTVDWYLANGAWLQALDQRPGVGRRRGLGPATQA